MIKESPFPFIVFGFFGVIFSWPEVSASPEKPPAEPSPFAKLNNIELDGVMYHKGGRSVFEQNPSYSRTEYFDLTDCGRAKNVRVKPIIEVRDPLTGHVLNLDTTKELDFTDFSNAENISVSSLPRLTKLRFLSNMFPY